MLAFKNVIMLLQLGLSEHFQNQGRVEPKHRIYHSSKRNRTERKETQGEREGKKEQWVLKYHVAPRWAKGILTFIYISKSLEG